MRFKIRLIQKEHFSFSLSFISKKVYVLNISNIILLKLFLNGGSALVYMVMIHWFMATVIILLEIKRLFHSFILNTKAITAICLTHDFHH